MGGALGAVGSGIKNVLGSGGLIGMMKGGGDGAPAAPIDPMAQTANAIGAQAATPGPMPSLEPGAVLPPAPAPPPTMKKQVLDALSKGANDPKLAKALENKPGGQYSPWAAPQIPTVAPPQDPFNRNFYGG